ncbi:flagellar/basal body protein, PACRG family protein [Cardiosporidium cionae]|uniref:Flagellar/basal body protein, PACRG family protein n=1 Tax=Cardiosporidium cionae TaxID=476202 RepID=A0ABQ7J8S6_9APIC|nr:flagellar/basal body protein, PACRG family protein [Cardiosporidium cionae]|eukprot:KAF8820403.1 flagellar/basal body protein, PACRG family protein [Cardiosporidium cionae]
MQSDIIRPRIALTLNDARKKMIDPGYRRRDHIEGMLPRNAESPFGDFPESRNSLSSSNYKGGIRSLKSQLRASKNVNARQRISPTELRRFYNRGDLPVCIHHQNSHNTIEWKEDINTLNYHCFLPIFFDGLREKEDPYRLLAVQGVYDLLNHGKSKILAVIPQLILPIQRALQTRDTEVIATVLKILQVMNRQKNIGDQIDYSQRLRLDVGELIDETLQLFDKHGGENAYINIKYMVPTYENCDRHKK